MPKVEIQTPEGWKPYGEYRSEDEAARVAETLTKMGFSARVSKSNPDLERWIPGEVPEYKPAYTGYDKYFRKGKDDFVNIFQLKEAPERYVVTYVHRERPPLWLVGIESPRTYKSVEDLIGWKQVERKVKELKKEGYEEVPKSEVEWVFR